MQLQEKIETRLDRQFEESKDLYWLPFVGKNYLSSNNNWLVVGESHYIPDEENENRELYSSKDWTRKFILKEGLQLIPFYVNTPKNKLIREVERTLFDQTSNDVWNSLAYFNLIQRLLPSIVERPTFNDISKGLQAFLSILPILKPAKVLFCGVTTAKHFKNILEKNEIQVEEIRLEKVKINGAYPRKFKVKIDSKEIECVFIKHPSKRYSFEQWKQFI